MIDHLEKAWRRVAAISAHHSRGRGVLQKLARRKVAVLMYHGVTAQPLPTFHWCQLPSLEFRRQVEWLANHDYRVLALSEVVDRLGRERPLPDRTAVLTFDDGLRNVRSEAMPVLMKYQMPCTVFLITDLVGTNQPAWPDQLYHGLMVTAEPSVRFQGKDLPLGPAAQRADAHRAIIGVLKTLPDPERRREVSVLFDALGQHLVPQDSPLATLGWDQVEAMAATGLVEFGAHTATHPILSRCSVALQREELVRSRDAIRERLGPSDLLAYPNGSRSDFTRTTKRLAEELGFRCAVATLIGLHRAGSDLYAIRRIPVGADSTEEGFERSLLGLP